MKCAYSQPTTQVVIEVGISSSCQTLQVFSKMAVLEILDRRIHRSIVLLLLLGLQQVLGNVVFASAPGHEKAIYADKTLALGIGYGIVKMNSNVKVTDKDSGARRFIDLEGTLGLPGDSYIPTIYGAYRFNEKHSLLFGHFAVDRESTLLDIDRNFNDLVLIKADVTLTDNTRFYYLSYGYKLFQDDRSDVTLVLGLNVMDFRLSAEAVGQITVGGFSRTESEVVDVDVVAPLPLLGLNFGFNFNPKWSIATRISLIGGSYQEVSANVVQTTINSRYQISKHVGLLIGFSYFDAEVDVNDEDYFTEVSYAYNGAFLGIHAGF